MTGTAASPLAHKNLSLNDISISGRARLLDMAYSRLRFGIFAMPGIAIVFTWYHCLHSENNTLIIAWACGYWLFATAAYVQYKHYQQDNASLPADIMLQKWLPTVEKLATLHGLAIAIAMFLVQHTATIEFKYLYLLTMAAIVAGNATHQSPMLSVFQHFLATCWHLSVLMMPWTIASHWQFVMPLSAIYSVGMHYYSKKSHHFFVQLIWLEEEGARLAERYKSAKEEAESALQAKNQFLSTASHDLRQPVHAMGFLIESIARRNQDQTLMPALKDLKLSIRSVTQMFNSLLDLSKIESGKIELRKSTVFVDDLIKDIATVFSEEARARNLEIRTRSSKAGAIVIADGVLLRQSIMNLMHNALRYTKRGGVLISTRKRNNEWLIEVWDTGIGVAIEDYHLVYSPFYRNEHAWRLDNAGHGLGLSVVARCCELMGCQYGFSSQLGRGSRFWLRLPAVAGRLQSIRIINETKTNEPWALHTMLSGSCLIVDDDPQVVNAWELLLSSWGVSVRCAESSTEAFNILNQGFTPDAILCDQRLRAGESGFDVLRALLARCSLANGAMVSGEFNSPELLEAESEGYLVLHKPLEPEVLHTLLSRWLNHSTS